MAARDQPTQHWSRKWLIGLFVLALVPRLTLLVLRPGALEVWEYETLAESIAGLHGYVITRWGHVAVAFGDGHLYSFGAAALYYLVGHQPMVLAVLQAIIASLAFPVIFAIGARAFNVPVAALGAALAALHPGLLAYTAKLHPLGLDVLLMAMMVLWILRASDGPRSGLMAGLATGLTVMSRPTFVVAGVAALAVTWWATRRNLLAIAAAILLALAIAAPWMARNWSVLGRPVFISTGLEDVWKGNNPNASGSSYLPSGEEVFSTMPADLRERLRGGNELTVNDEFAQEIWIFVSSEPGQFVRLFARKFVYFWWHSPQAGVLYPSSWLAMYDVYAVVMYAFALVAAFVIVRAGSASETDLLRTLLTVGLTLALIHALSYVEGRHRWAIEPLLLLLTARGIFVIARVVARVRLYSAFTSAHRARVTGHVTTITAISRAM